MGGLYDFLGFNDIWVSQITPWMDFEYCARVVIAIACGALIGIERSRRLKEAGIRTHVIVCVGATLAMIVSKYGFTDLERVGGEIFMGTRDADPSRIAAQVISGISFLGAGVIFKTGASVKGLTTAAGLWVTACIGLAVGAGMYVVSFFTTICILLLQIFMHRFTIGGDALSADLLQFTVDNDPDFFETLRKQLTEWDMQIMESEISRVKGKKVRYRMLVRGTKALSQEEFYAFMDSHPEIVSGSNTPVK